MLKERSVQLMIPVMFFNGIEAGFWQTIFPTCIGATKLLGEDADHLVGLASICTCLGILCAPAFLISIPNANRFRGYLYSSSMIGFFIACTLCVLMLPPESVMQDTNNMALIPPNEIALMIGAVLLGFADGVLNTNLIVMIGTTHPSISKGHTPLKYLTF